MDFNATIDLIIRELEEAREIMDDLKKMPDAPTLEIELAKSKIRNAAEVIALLKQRKETLPLAKKEEPPSGKTERNQGHGEGKIITSQKEVIVKHKEPDSKTEHPDNDTLEIVAEEEKKDPGKPEIESTEQKPFVSPIIADTFSHLANRFNEQIGENQGEDFSYSHGRHYTNLAEVIGVNDRFYYIREVFDGNRDAYNEAISRLEKAQNMNEAKEIVLSYRKDKHDIPATKQLLDLVKRKFNPHE